MSLAYTFLTLFEKDTTIKHKSIKAEGQTASFFQMMHNCKYAIGLMGKPTKKERLFYNPTNAIRFNNAIHRCIAYGLQLREKDQVQLFSSSSIP